MPRRRRGRAAAFASAPRAASNAPVSDDPSPRNIHVVAAAAPRLVSAEYPRERISFSSDPAPSPAHPAPRSVRTERRRILTAASGARPLRAAHERHASRRHRGSRAVRHASVSSSSFAIGSNGSVCARRAVDVTRRWRGGASAATPATRYAKERMTAWRELRGFAVAQRAQASRRCGRDGGEGSPERRHRLALRVRLALARLT